MARGDRRRPAQRDEGDSGNPRPGPTQRRRVRDWQAVVVGGGIINGITLSGAWPGERIEHTLKGDRALAPRWRAAVEQAAAMADNETVPTGTRYDALRILGLDTWDRRGAQLFRYLVKDVDAELQQGAISALGDMPSPYVAPALLSGLGHYSEYNRGLALDALLRDEPRNAALLEAVAEGRLRAADLGEARTKTLLELNNADLRDRARRLLPK